VADVFNNFLVFNIVGSLSRKEFPKRISIKESFYSRALILVFKREYFLPK